MKRFILVSFAFLAVAFYELSGGSDFDPVEARNAAVMARTGSSEVPQETKTQIARKAPEDDNATVTRMSLNLTSFNDVLNEKDEASPVRTILAKPELDATPQTVSVAPVAALNATTVTFDTTPDAQGVLPSIVFPGSTSRASSETASARRDIRFVSAAVVNMRGGPGTEYDVVTKLNQDTEVEILQDDGTGWVKLRPVAGGPEGWIAVYLLTNG